MATVTVPTKVIRHREPPWTGKFGKWSKWHIIRLTDSGRIAVSSSPFDTCWTICNHLYEYPNGWNGESLTEISELSAISIGDLCGKCTHGLIVSD